MEKAEIIKLVNKGRITACGLVGSEKVAAMETEEFVNKYITQTGVAKVTQGPPDLNTPEKPLGPPEETLNTPEETLNTPEETSKEPEPEIISEENNSAPQNDAPSVDPEPEEPVGEEEE